MSITLRTSVKGLDEERYQVMAAGTSGLTVGTVIDSAGVTCNNTFHGLKLKRLADLTLSLETCPWSVVSEYATDGTAASLWAVGDKKSVTFASTFMMDTKSPPTYEGADRVLAGTKVYFRILGFDHNMNIESPGVHTIHFGLATDEADHEIVFVKQRFSTKVNTGGGTSGTGSILGPYTETWNRGCLVRTACARLKTCLPADLQAVIKTVYKGQSDNSWATAPTSNTYTSEVKQQNDEIFIPNYNEIYSKARYDNHQTSNEQNVSQQYDYYNTIATTAESRQKHYHTTGTDQTVYMTRSYFYYQVESNQSTSRIICVGKDGKGGHQRGFENDGYGLLACFAV